MRRIEVAKNKVNNKSVDTENEEVKQVEDTKELYSTENLKNEMNEYFKTRKEKGLPYTLEGICLHLDLKWEQFIDCLNRNDEIGKIFKRAYMKIKDRRVTEVARVSSTSNVEGNWLLLKNMNDYGCKYE
jgi:hypothetical protein